jgi:hypothetical protein
MHKRTPSALVVGVFAAVMASANQDTPTPEATGDSGEEHKASELR